MEKTSSLLVSIKWNVASRATEVILVLCSGETHQCAGSVSVAISAKKICSYFAGSNPTKGRTVARGHKLKNMKFHLNREKHFFPMRIVEHWHSLPR